MPMTGPTACRDDEAEPHTAQGSVERIHMVELYLKQITAEILAKVREVEGCIDYAEEELWTLAGG